MYKDEFSIVNIVHHILAEKIKPGDRVLDGTAGQGNDTLHLAKLVGPNGFVWAFDVQKAACAITEAKLEQEGIDWVRVICDNHANLARYVDASLKAGVFNLGYLPGQNHQVITNGHTTIAAAGAVMEKLQPGGILLFVCYVGHAGGREEYEMLIAYLQKLAAKEWWVSEFSLINKKNAPRLVMVKKINK